MNSTLITTTSDIRQTQLCKWVAKQFSTQTDSPADDLPITLKPLGGDAGFRRYFRFEIPSSFQTSSHFQTPSEWLAVDAPPSTEDSQQFVALANALRQAGLKTPLIKAVDYTHGWLLVEDFGDELLFNQTQRTPNKIDSFYSSSFASLLKLQNCAIKNLVPHYDEPLLTKELDIFGEWFVSKLLGYELNTREKTIITAAFSLLVASALEQPQCLVHRDFHSRNLICIDKETLGILDFQGAVWGPCTYDLVSLLRDCYLRWPNEQVERWALEYHRLAIAAGLLRDDIDCKTYIGWLDWMGLQRHIKVLGIFARLNLRDNKPHYLKDLPLVMRYTLEVCAKYPQLSDFYRLFNEKLLPLAKTQPWYQPWETAGEQS